MQHLYLNNNPLQFVPIEITDCRKLSVLDLSHTYVKTLPIEMALLKQLYDLNLKGCELKPALENVYKQGIVHVLKFYEDKMEREKYRDLIVKACQEQLWVESQPAEIGDVMAKVILSLETDDIYLLKRLMRNLKYMLPLQIELVDPYLVRQNLMTSRAAIGRSSSPGTMNASLSESMRPRLNQSIKLHLSDIDIQQSIHIQDSAPLRSEGKSVSEHQLVQVVETVPNKASAHEVQRLEQVKPKSNAAIEPLPNSKSQKPQQPTPVLKPSTTSKR